MGNSFAKEKEKKQNETNVDYYSLLGHDQIQSQSQIIFCAGKKQKDYEDRLSYQHKAARSKFFTHQLKAKIKESKATKVEQSEIIALFLEEQQKINLDTLMQLRKHRKQIQQLKLLLQSIVKQNKQKQTECVPMQHIIRHKLDNLKVISIKYEPKIDNNGRQECRHSISAFELFKIVHANKSLNQVTLKGVNVQSFQQFIHVLNETMHSQSNEQKQMDEFSWMNKFNPPNSIKLSIDTKVDFVIQDKNDILLQVNDLAFFITLFQVSGITIFILLGAWILIDQQPNKIWQFWICLQKIRKGQWYYKISLHSVAAVRSLLFGGLATFTQIDQLQFNQFKFVPQVGINDFLAIELSLSILFENNIISCLRLQNCQNFPIFPSITTLHTIHVQTVSFRKQCNFAAEIMQANPLLKFIKLQSMRDQPIQIYEKLLNQIQSLRVKWCRHISFGSISQKSPSKLKHLSINHSNIGGIDSLFVLFSKLVSLTKLQASFIDFQHQLLCTIPSPHLEDLLIHSNYVITDKGLQVIDSKWPYLRNINIINCNKITANVWKNCKFKGLMRLTINQRMLGKGNQAQYNLKRRGINVIFDY